jgi:hypothetical protein
MENSHQIQNTNSPTRCVIAVDKNLPSGRAANAAAVIALTIGARHPQLVGCPLIDASGEVHPGLIPVGITVLAADVKDLQTIREKGLSVGCDIVDFPVEGQLTKDYPTFCNAVMQIETESINYAGIALIGDNREIRKIVSHLKLL